MNLCEFENLNLWYEQHKLSRLKVGHEILLMAICQSIKTDFDLNYIHHGLSRFLAHSVDVCQDYLEVEKVLSKDDFELEQFWSFCAHYAVQQDDCSQFRTEFRKFSNGIGKSSFQFLNAWMAFNHDEFGLCIRDCDEIKPSFGAVLTLKGQAELESGDAEAAIESLLEATRLTPNDLLSWFQLAKAGWTESNENICSMALQECRDIAPTHPEVILFSMMLSTYQENVDLASELWPLLDRVDDDLFSKSDWVIEALNLALLMHTSDELMWLMEKVNWHEVFRNPDFLKAVVKPLRKMGERNWMKACKILLTKAGFDQPSDPSATSPTA